MNDFKEQSTLMGKRLKALRESKGISHVALRDELRKKYDIDISRDSLINYEVSDKEHPKAFKNDGMRVEYLRYLADFYGVSTDYLLGLTDVKTPDASLRAVCEYTGLSETTIHSIKNNRCSLCGYSEYDPVKYTRFKYCPHCGAKIDLED